MVIVERLKEKTTIIIEKKTYSKEVYGFFYSVSRLNPNLFNRWKKVLVLLHLLLNLLLFILMFCKKRIIFETQRQFM